MSKILVTGLYNSNYPRNQSLIASFRELGEVTEWPLSGRWLGSIKLSFFLAFSRRYQYAIIFQPVFFVLPFLRLIKSVPGRPKIIIDAFISAYDTYISDRQLKRAVSWHAKFYRWLDKLAGRAGEGIFFDTAEHQEYFNLPQQIAQAVIPVVPNYDRLGLIKANKKFFQTDKINVFFYGNYIPLQGVPTIIEAAKILQTEPKINFTILGAGQDFKKVKSLAEKYELNNVIFLPKSSYENVIAILKAANIALGVFGTSEKMQRVIPNKVLEALAVNTPLITGESQAVKKYFQDNEEIFFVPPGNPEALAQKIKEISFNPNLAKQVSEAGQTKVKKEFNQTLIQSRLREFITRVK